MMVCQRESLLSAVLQIAMSEAGLHNTQKTWREIQQHFGSVVSGENVYGDFADQLIAFLQLRRCTKQLKCNNVSKWSYQTRRISDYQEQEGVLVMLVSAIATIHRSSQTFLRLVQVMLAANVHLLPSTWIK